MDWIIGNNNLTCHQRSLCRVVSQILFWATIPQTFTESRFIGVENQCSSLFHQRIGHIRVIFESETNPCSTTLLISLLHLFFSTTCPFQLILTKPRPSSAQRKKALGFPRYGVYRDWRCAGRGKSPKMNARSRSKPRRQLSRQLRRQLTRITSRVHPRTLCAEEKQFRSQPGFRGTHDVITRFKRVILQNF